MTYDLWIENPLIRSLVVWWYDGMTVWWAVMWWIVDSIVVDVMWQVISWWIVSWWIVLW